MIIVAAQYGHVTRRSNWRALTFFGSTAGVVAAWRFSGDCGGKDLTLHQQPMALGARVKTILVVHHRGLERLPTDRTRQRPIPPSTKEPQAPSGTGPEPNRRAAMIAVPGWLPVEQRHRRSAVGTVHGRKRYHASDEGLGTRDCEMPGAGIEPTRPL